MRLNLLDRLDAITGDLYQEDRENLSDSGLILRAKSLRLRLEAANEKIYEAAHAEIVLQGNSPMLNRWLSELVDGEEVKKPRSGFSFDLLDEIVSGVLRLCGSIDTGSLPYPEMTAYQPTPARHILDLIAMCRFTSNDLLVDLGSGLGHVPLLVSILEGIPTLGVEIQSDHAASAQQTAQRLNLSRVRFVAGDARTTDLSCGTVFYMFTPFSGSILADVLHRLYRQSKIRQIRICALGPCTRILQGQPWLRENQRSAPERISIFRSL